MKPRWYCHIQGCERCSPANAFPDIPSETCCVTAVSMDSDILLLFEPIPAVCLNFWREFWTKIVFWIGDAGNFQSSTRKFEIYTCLQFYKEYSPKYSWTFPACLGISQRKWRKSDRSYVVIWCSAATDGAAEHQGGLVLSERNAEENHEWQIAILLGPLSLVWIRQSMARGLAHAGALASRVECHSVQLSNHVLRRKTLFTDAVSYSIVKGWYTSFVTFMWRMRVLLSSIVLLIITNIGFAASFVMLTTNSFFSGYQEAFLPISKTKRAMISHRREHHSSSWWSCLTFSYPRPCHLLHLFLFHPELDFPLHFEMWKWLSTL